MTAFTLYSTPGLTTRKPRRVSARYDGAAITKENRRHWGAADGLSATSANTPAIRKRLRERARLERENDPYISGLVETVAGDVVGSGPVLQVGYADPKVNTEIETRWNEWCDATNFFDSLQMLEESRITDGDDLLIPITNPRNVEKCGVSLDVNVIEADQFDDPYGYIPALRIRGDSGVMVDAIGRPTHYCVLRRHPGDMRGMALAMRGDWLPESRVIHWMRKRRPGQLRGVSELASVLNLLPLIRRYRTATVQAAEVAARFAVLLESNQANTIDNIGDSDDDESKEFEEFELPQTGGMTLPPGFKASQLKPEQPTSQFGTFEDRLLRGAGRSVGSTLGSTTGDHSSYNYSSARLDQILRRGRRDRIRNLLRIIVLDRILALWAWEARLARILPSEVTNPERIPHKWTYESDPSIDPLKDATADDMRLKGGTANLADVLGGRGRDVQQFIEQRQRECQLLEAAGMNGLAQLLRGNANMASQPANVAAIAEEVSLVQP